MIRCFVFCQKEKWLNLVGTSQKEIRLNLVGTGKYVLSLQRYFVQRRTRELGRQINIVLCIKPHKII